MLASMLGDKGVEIPRWFGEKNEAFAIKAWKSLPALKLMAIRNGLKQTIERY